MKVLLTNVRLEQRAGTELYVLDVARWLRDAGHSPVAYSARLGPLADEFRRESIPVVSDLELIGEPPDIIHGQHHLATMTALAWFPRTPAVNFCHGWTPWEESPVRHPAVRRYVAVGTLERERLLVENGISPEIVQVIPNFVDLERFPRRGPLPKQPAKALVFSNHARSGGWFDAVRSACESRMIAVDVAGLASGAPLDDPGQVLGEYDLVFAKGRSALEAMAVGAAVVVCDLEGCGPLVTPDEFERVRGANYGQLVMRHSHHDAYLGDQIDRYDAASVGAVSDIVRSTLGRDAVVESLLSAYREAIADVEARPHSLEDARAAERGYLRWIDRYYPPAELESVGTIQRHAYELQDGLARAEAELEVAKAETARAQVGSVRALRELRRLESGFFVGTLLPRLWRLRERVAPTGSRRHRVYSDAISRMTRTRAQ